MPISKNKNGWGYRSVVESHWVQSPVPNAPKSFKIYRFSLENSLTAATATGFSLPVPREFLSALKFCLPPKDALVQGPSKNPPKCNWN